MKLSLKKGNKILGVAGILGGIIIIALAFIQKLPFMKKDFPGPGFFPILSGVGIAFCGALILIENKYKSIQTEEEKEGVEDSDLESNLINMVELKNLIYTIGISILILIVTPFIGLLCSTGLAVIILIRKLGEESIIKSIVIGVVTTLVLFVLFRKILGVPLPSSYIGI